MLDDRPSNQTYEVRFTPRIDTSPELAGAAAELAAVNEIMQASLAAGTISNYESSWNDWERFCEAHDWCPLPAVPEQVATYLTVVGAQVAEGALARDADGNPLPGRLRPNTVAHRISAINKVHEMAELRLPGEDRAVAAVLRGLRRMFGSAPVLAKAALDLPLLERLLAAVDRPPFDAARDAALLALQDACDPTAGQLARLDWVAIHLDSEPSVDLPSTGRGRPVLRHSLVERAGHPLCPVTALRRLRSIVPQNQYVFCEPKTGRPFSRQGVRQALLRLTGSSQPDPLTLRRAAIRLAQPTLRQRRDRALLLCGWWAALRRSNLSAARWDHTRIEHDGWELRLRRTKNNIDGAKDQRSWLVEAPDGWPCPVDAMVVWRDALAGALDMAPADLQASSYPLFVQIDRHGNIVIDAHGTPATLSGDAICTIVQDRASDAGLDADDFGAHSLRSGFITEALTDNKLSIAEVQEVTFHEDINVLIDYRRKVNGRTNSPLRRMFAHATRTDDKPVPPPSPADVLRRRQG